ACDGCDAMCRTEACGNGRRECIEQCDDGNLTAGDGCGPTCMIEIPRCGDTRVDPGEQCDDGNVVACDGCSATCFLEACGNGRRECMEGCDDGNTANGDGCDAMCAVELDFCGNGILEMGETCDLGAANVDNPAIEVTQPTGFSRVPRLVSRFNNAATFYGLVSASAHTGYEAASTSNLFMYRDLSTGTVSLFVVHGIDRTTSGIPQPLASVTFQISTVPSGTSVVISDDGGELRFIGGGLYQGDWNFQDNTDGGVIQGLPIPGNWTVRVDPTFRMGLSSWRWVDEPATFSALTMSQDVFITARSTPSMCRRDCTVPRCGDGRWDAGEVCDDGNTVSGDGCAADCRSVP
ncbi:MAG: DUF4215 domain-containing protein, partial [Sandaracinaceae bacterium]